MSGKLIFNIFGRLRRLKMRFGNGGSYEYQRNVITEQMEEVFLLL